MTLCLTQLHTDPLAVNMLFSSAMPDRRPELTWLMKAKPREIACMDNAISRTGYGILPVTIEARRYDSRLSNGIWGNDMAYLQRKMTMKTLRSAC